MSANKYIYMKEIAIGTKTRRFEVIGHKTGNVLGDIKWFGRWRQYTFFPHPDTTYNHECLDFIRTFLVDLMLKRKRR